MIRNLISTLVGGVALALVGMAQFVGAADAPVVDGACCPPACCPEACPKKVGVVTTETKKIEHHCYGEKCEDLCYPKCRCKWFGGWKKAWKCWDGGCGSGCDASCDTCDTCDTCGTVCNRKVLLIKVRREEVPVQKCTVQEECCDAAPCCPTTGPAVMPAAPKTEPVPAPKEGEAKPVTQEGTPLPLPVGTQQ